MMERTSFYLSGADNDEYVAESLQQTIIQEPLNDNGW